MTIIPHVPMLSLDTLWFQVAGTLCNLQCTHCFISSSPTNHSHEMLTLEAVKRHLAEAEALGVKEYWIVDARREKILVLRPRPNQVDREIAHARRRAGDEAAARVYAGLQRHFRCGHGE